MWKVNVLEAPRSTQEEALEYIKSNYKNEKLVFYSQNQTRGHGTKGRSWISSDISFAASFVFPLQICTDDSASRLLPIIFALIVANTLEKAKYCQELSLGIKWPNDLYKNGKKIAGILLHLLPIGLYGKGFKLAILGIGINIVWISPDIKLNATSIFDDVNSAKRFNAQNLIDDLTNNIDRMYNDNIFFNPRVEFGKRDMFKNQVINVSLNNNTIVSGKNMGIDKNGRLLLKETSKPYITKIEAGSIKWR